MIIEIFPLGFDRFTLDDGVGRGESPIERIGTLDRTLTPQFPQRGPRPMHPVTCGRSHSFDPPLGVAGNGGGATALAGPVGQGLTTHRWSITPISVNSRGLSEHNEFDT